MRKDSLLMDDGLGALIVCKAVRDCNMTATFTVDTKHLTAKELAVSRGIKELIDSDIIMNHLMEDGVPDEFLGIVCRKPWVSNSD